MLAIAVAPFASASGATAASACPDGNACVVVSVTGSATSSTTIGYDAVHGGDITANYAVRSADGSEISSGFVGLSMRALLQDAGVAPDAVTFIEISAGTRRQATLSHDDLGEPGSPGYPFVDGLQPAIFASGGDSLGYIQPLRGDDQPNPFIQADARDAVSVIVHTTGTLLHPVISTGTTSPKAGDPVAFTVTVPDAPAGALDYEWDFGDGPVSSGTEPGIDHSYATAGRYAAVVTVTGTDGSTGISNAVVITVGDPAPSTPAPSGAEGDSTATSAPTTGPTSGSGTRVGATPTPKPSPGKVRSTATPKPSSTAPAATPSPTRAPTSTATPRPSSTPSATAPPEPTATTTPPPVAAGGEQVSGIVISGTTGEAPPSVDAQNAGASAPAQRSGASVGPGWGAVAALGTVALLGVGALAESGRLSSAASRITSRLRRRWR